MRFTVAIDGPAAAGKGTLARAVADHFGFAHLDTGLLYRATGRRVLHGEDAVDAATHLKVTDLDAPDLRTPDVAQIASKVAANPEVRAALIAFQKAFARRSGGAVLDGRDIGTVICPDADVKLFVTASDHVRAKRRCAELIVGGHDVSLNEVLFDLQTRDTRDAARSTAPMRAADDAVVLDTSEMDVDAACEKAIDLIAAIIARQS